MAERFNGRIQQDVLSITLASHAVLERLLKSYEQIYNARRQRVLNGCSPDQVVRRRLKAKPQLANPHHTPPDRKALPDAMRVVQAAKDVSHPDN